MKKIFSFVLLALAFSIQAQNTIDLSGKWGFQMDRNDEGVDQKWFNKLLTDEISLPGSMPEKLKGDDITLKTKWTGTLYDSSYYFNPVMEPYRQEGNIMLPFFLTPVKHYVGVAWYNKEVNVPASWNGERVVLFLERPHIETRLWIDGKEVGMQNSLSVPHEYDVTPYMTKGKHRIALRIDNRIKEINVGPESHSITDQTQGNWNGVVGKLELRKTPKTYFENIQIFPNLKEKKALVKIEIASQNKKAHTATINLSAESFNTQTPHQVPAVSKTIQIADGKAEVEIELPMGEEMQTWDEFNPALYRLKATLLSAKKQEQKNIQFGMREIKIDGKWFYVNGVKTMLRGTVENCLFPLTGYPPMDVASWEKVFRVCKNYGLNHVRYHSYCPPQAAFIAADKVGIYMQPEGPSWPNHGPKLGNGEPLDKYLWDECVAMSKVYGNSPSFAMMACGNEPSGRWVAWVSKFVDYWKEADKRRVYTGASVGGSWQWQPKNQYHVKAGARGLDWGRSMPESMSDFRGRIDTVSQPFVSHETGQWCVYPNFDEIRKYTGVNKARNFEIFQDLLKRNDMEGKGRDFMMASGKLQALCYKHEIERTLRTPDYAGFQLLALNDYSGQGSAIIGLTDVFFEDKGYINAEQFRRFCSQTVPLIRVPKFVYKNNETIQAQVEVAHFGQATLPNAEITYTLKTKDGALLTKGSLGKKEIPVGNAFSLGTITLPLNQLTEAQKINLEVRIAGTEAVNDWDFWVYPETLTVNQGDVYVTEKLDDQAQAVLKKGGKVLLLANGKISYGKDAVQQFLPVFWNTSWFKMRPPHTLGIFLNEYHPIFKDFPTEYHSNLQWWELLNRTQTMQLTDFPKGFQPLVQTIDTWFIARKLGVLFETNVMGGKLVMTTMDLRSDLDKRVVARQMYASILNYMNSDHFRPSYSVDIETIQELFTKVAPPIDFNTKDTPQELKPKTGDAGI